MDLSRFPKAELAHLPTPLEKLERLSKHLEGPGIFAKRDDCTGLAIGGNKTRKLEYAIGDALAKGADTIVTAGPLQSNHTRQSAAACNKLGLRCDIVLSTSADWHEPCHELTSNQLLLDILGTNLHYVETEWDRPATMEKVAEQLRQQGFSPYILPAGASNAAGSLGYAQCAEELLEQAEAQDLTIDRIILPTGSGGTQGGLIAGLVAMEKNIEVIGIDVDAAPEMVYEWTLDCAQGAGKLLGVDVNPGFVRIVQGYAGPAYGVPTAEMTEALRLSARLEGLVLDPVYSGKAMAGLIDLVKRGEIRKDENIVFIHTGGTPALFAYQTALLSKVRM